jgi:hypothetical protein
MQSIGRPRQYVSSARLYAMFPLLRFSYERGAYILRFVGESRGPVLRKDRRRRQRELTGVDRRAGGVDLLASRPVGNVRRIEVGEPAARATGPSQAAPRATGPSQAAPRATGPSQAAPGATGPRQAAPRTTGSGETAPRPAGDGPAPMRVPNTKRSRAAQTQATRRRRQGGQPPPPRPHR